MTGKTLNKGFGDYFGASSLRDLTPPKEESTKPASVEPPVTPAVDAAVDTAVDAAVDAAVTAAVTAPITTDRSVPLDATHTSAEAKVYGVMYRATISHGRPERRFTVPEIQAATGIRSDKTVRTAMHGLAAKLSITIVDPNRSSNHGPLYRVHPPRDVAAARRRMRMVIDEQSKRIVNAPVDAPVTPAVGAAVPGAVGAAVNFTGAVTGRSFHDHEKHDDDMSAVRAAIVDMVPGENPAAVEAAVTKIGELVAIAIRRASTNASEPPVTAAYAVEVIRRALARTTTRQARENEMGIHAVADRADEPKGAAELLAARASAYRGSHPQATSEDVRAELERFVIGAGLVVDASAVNAAIEETQL